MASRPLIIATLVGASVAVPYFTSKAPNGKSGTNNAPAIGSYGQQQRAAATRLPIVTSSLPMTPQAPGAPAAVNRVALNCSQFTSIDQVLRFDVSKEWVYQN